MPSGVKEVSHQSSIRTQKAIVNNYGLGLTETRLKTCPRDVHELKFQAKQYLMDSKGGCKVSEASKWRTRARSSKFEEGGALRR